VTSFFWELHGTFSYFNYYWFELVLRDKAIAHEPLALLAQEALH